MRSFCLVILLVIPAIIIAKDGYPRNKDVDIIHYDFSLSLNDSTNMIEGQSAIIVKFLAAIDSISFDLSAESKDGHGMIVTNVTISGKPVKWTHSNERLTLFSLEADNDTAEIRIFYHGIPADGLIISKNKFGKRVFFSDHWPDRAHNYLPCIDHPYDKASVSFTITAPDHYSIVANGLLMSETIPAAGLKCTKWQENVPLPVKVMAFGAADFAVLDTAKVDGIPVSSWVFTENMKEGFYDYSVAVKPLGYYIWNIGDYPYGKLANVQSKTIYGGLENASAIFYAERSVTGKGRAEGLIAHEIAHQWFGDNVTENDWHHVWLSEGFATYLTSMYFEHTRGEEALKNDLDSTRSRLIRYYRKNRKPVIDTTETDLMNLLNMNTYQKGAWVLHMLRNDIGDDAFMKGLRLFYERYSNSNVLTEDFKNVIEEVSGKQLDGFFHQWLLTPGHPELHFRVKGKNLIIEQRQHNLFDFPIEVKLISPGGEKIVRILVAERVTKYRSDRKISSIQPDPEVKLLFNDIK
ncbi:MAG TPA: M1 family metallopeptidase [Bacteroidales bacterium]|nr:M1 family metallopeptidase [Bacteroidales bacterium]